MTDQQIISTLTGECVGLGVIAAMAWYAARQWRALARTR